LGFFSRKEVKAMKQALNFIAVNVTAIGVSLISDLMEKAGWSSGKTLKLWLCGWNKQINFNNFQTTGKVELENEKCRCYNKDS